MAYAESDPLKERIKELEQRVLDEQSAFDKMEELYLQERESRRALEDSMEITQEAIERSSVNFNLALDESGEREENLRNVLKEVIFQFEGLVQFVSEDDYLDDELEALFVDLFRTARLTLEWSP